MKLVPLAVREPTEARPLLRDGRGAPCRDLRCGCGSLLARRVASGVELKCRRCKRTLLLSLDGG